MDGPAITVAGVAKSFGDSHALAGCSLTAHDGEIHAIVGENGSGKSTLSKIVSGVIRADRGTVEVLGKPAPKSPRLARRAGIELVAQEVLVVEGATIVDNLFLGHDGFIRSAASRREKAARARELLERVSGESYDPFLPIESLPLSVRQWVVIARAMVRRPKVLILDEATAALDGMGAARLYGEVKKLAAAGTCVLTVTHRIEELKGYADRATVLRDGVTVGTLPGTEITEARLLEMMSGDLFAGENVGGSRRLVPDSERVTIADLRLRPGAQPVSLRVRAGEIIGVAALEGHGGPELVQAVAGISGRLAGTVEVTWRGRTARIRSQRDAVAIGVAYVSGDRKREGIFPNMSVLDNFGMAMYRTTRSGPLIGMRAVRAKLAEESARLALRSPGEHANIGALSGGNQQKVLIARSLAAMPSVLVLNDPTRGVDIRTKHDIYLLLRELSEQGVGVLFFSTEIEEFAEVCHRVAIMRSGGLFTVLDAGEMATDRILGALFGQQERFGIPAPSGEESPCQA